MAGKLLFIVNNLSFFVSHRLPIGLAAKEHGYQVTIACPESEDITKIRDLGVDVVAIPVSQQNHSPFAQIRFCYAVYKTCRQLKPDICHMITLKTFLVAGTAARIAGVKKRLGSVSGLGYFFMSNNRKNKILRHILRPFFHFAMGGQGSRVIFQNQDDKVLLQNYAGIIGCNTEMIEGSGVDLHQFPYSDETGETVKVVLISRMLRDKGVIEFVEAVGHIKECGLKAEFILAGMPDKTNPASLSEEQLERWNDLGHVHWIGFCDDVPKLLANSHIVVLPSYREGFPKVLIEAAASGRAVITTDVPGCRDAITVETGILVPVRDSKSLEGAIVDLVENKEKRQKMGRKGYELALSKFSIQKVIDKHLEIYKKLMEQMASC